MEYGKQIDPRDSMVLIFGFEFPMPATLGLLIFEIKSLPEGIWISWNNWIFNNKFCWFQRGCISTFSFS